MAEPDRDIAADCTILIVRVFPDGDDLFRLEATMTDRGRVITAEPSGIYAASDRDPVAMVEDWIWTWLRRGFEVGRGRLTSVEAYGVPQSPELHREILQTPVRPADRREPAEATP
jgi:hypothetical protein